ncbi:hypothetical protein B0H13DRAFT_2503839 [Mycena leptocephala]|nr:hypothetical protein B0H13DRAFT_2503839 [Mycena leptocephala]
MGTDNDLTDVMIHANTAPQLLVLALDYNGPPSKTLPWDAWTLDKQFLKDLDTWIGSHPDGKLSMVLEGVCRAIESGKDLAGFIPDSPFPARSLMQGLGGLIKLGNTVSKAKSAALQFAKKIVHWIENVLKASQDGNTGQFTLKAWDNLDSVRVLVDEICQWAKARLEDKWKFWKKLAVDAQIQEFQSRLDEATKLFMILSEINLSHAQDLLLMGNVLILEEVEKARENIQKVHENIERVLEDVSYLCGEVQEKRLEEQYHVDLTFIKKELGPYIASNSGYQEQGKESCHPGTRVELLANIQEWVSDLSTEGPHFLWVTGEPGSGKSTITAAVCRAFKDSHCLWAQLFINRNYQNTANPRFFFPSIAFQLAERSREVAHVISHALQEKPSLVDEVTEALVQQLFADPLRSASETTPLQAIAIVVDGLDECDSSDLPKLLSNMTTCLPANTKVLISSREEDAIRAAWATAPDTRQISVGTHNKSSIDDVESFLRHQIQDIATKYHLDEWPGEEEVQKLCSQASGLFIWATTAMKYIRSQIEISGSECLDDVLDQLNTKGMEDIHLLYGTILDKLCPRNSDPWKFETFRRLVGSIVVLNKPLSIGTLEKILDLRQPGKRRPVDVPHFFRRFRTVLVAGTDEITQETIPRLHKSFFEFVTSEIIRPELRVSLLLSHQELGPKCLAHSDHAGDSFFHAARSSYQRIVNELPDDVSYLLSFGDLEYSNYQHCGDVTSLDISVSLTPP